MRHFEVDLNKQLLAPQFRAAILDHFRLPKASTVFMPDPHYAETRFTFGPKGPLERALSLGRFLRRTKRGIASTTSRRSNPSVQLTRRALQSATTGEPKLAWLPIPIHSSVSFGLSKREHRRQFFWTIDVRSRMPNPMATC
jgi:hypothetical protein